MVKSVNMDRKLESTLGSSFQLLLLAEVETTDLEKCMNIDVLHTNEILTGKETYFQLS